MCSSDLFTVLLRRSVFHTWPAWLGAFLFLSPAGWSSTRWVDYGRWAEVFVATAGWATLVIATATCAVVWWRGEGADDAGVEKQEQGTTA